ncbi:amino acid ABC transporter permease [Salinisphaera hydrothermalis]|uniref:Amino acid ABC transporter permease n=1 Tax=Salinisphaera hydrothermalis (strain C41B8) TaxID=1304275 RepID=A0A084IPW1_SALHC|nr:amino acid ABC transporter permease [Salinisphaera hydrothermalis]KEZ78745.1 amino acid ABC transporter permease [Salinisphaera hydrothermalis C41B8]
MADPNGHAVRSGRSPRQRARRRRAIQYVALAIVIGVLAFMADWPTIGHTFFDPALILNTAAHGLWRALWNTLVYSAGGFVIGLAAGTLLALMRLSEVAPYRWLATLYIEFFRGLPALIVFIALSLLPLAFQGLAMPFSPYGTVWAALGIVGSAYMAETIRAGILAVPRGQIEAARSLGLSPAQTLRQITLPQAFRLMIPPLTNELIMLIKDSSLVFIVGLSAANFDLTKFGRAAANNHVNITPLVVAGLGYLIITLPLSIVVRRMEARAASGRRA